MESEANLLEIKAERTISAAPKDVYDAWLNADFPGTPWNAASKLILDIKPDGLFYSRMNDIAHYGRFIKLDPAREIQHSWVSSYTEGQESIVTVTFAPQGKGTRMTLVHSGLPNNAKGQAHEGGWRYFLDLFPQQFATVD